MQWRRPEAHLHPHVQRLVYRYFLETKAAADDGERAGSLTTILTTHSPHIASVLPIRSIVLLRHDAAKGATIAVSTANTSLTSISPRRGPSRRSPASGWGVAAQRATHGARLPGRAGQLFRVRLMDGSDGIRLQSRRTRLWIRLGHGVPRAWQSRCSSPLQWTSGIRAEVAAVMTGKVSRYRASLDKERFLRSFTTRSGGRSTRRSTSAQRAWHSESASALRFRPRSVTPADGSQSLQNACAVHQRDGHPSASKTATGSR